MGGKLPLATLTGSMFQRIRDVRLMIRLSRLTALEARGDYPGALEAVERISYGGPLAAVLGAYISKLIAMNRDARALDYVRSVRRLIRECESNLDCRSYCVAYCDYLECVLSDQPYELAGKMASSQPASRFVRGILLIV